AATARHPPAATDPERGARDPALPASAASFPANAQAASRSARRARLKDHASPAAAYSPSRAIPQGARRARSATSAAPAGRLHEGWRRGASADGGDRGASSSVVILEINIDGVLALEGECEPQVAGNSDRPTSFL